MFLYLWIILCFIFETKVQKSTKTIFFKSVHNTNSNTFQIKTLKMCPYSNKNLVIILKPFKKIKIKIFRSVQKFYFTLLKILIKKFLEIMSSYKFWAHPLISLFFSYHHNFSCVHSLSRIDIFSCIHPMESDYLILNLWIRSFAAKNVTPGRFSLMSCHKEWQRIQLPKLLKSSSFVLSY